VVAQTSGGLRKTLERITKSKLKIFYVSMNGSTIKHGLMKNVQIM
jgi:hypothetical protein